MFVNLLKSISFVSRQEIMKEEKKINSNSTDNKCIEIFKQGFERRKILYSCGNPRESCKIFYYVHFIEYAIFNKS